VSSVAGFLIGAGSATYCATKAYLINFTETLHLELQGTGIRMQALCPGFTLTDFHRKLGYDTTTEAFKAFMSSDAVVEHSLKDLQRGRVISVPGLKYRLVAMGARLVPRSMFYFIVKNVQRSQVHRASFPVSRPNSEQ